MNKMSRVLERCTKFGITFDYWLDKVILGLEEYRASGEVREGEVFKKYAKSIGSVEIARGLCFELNNNLTYNDKGVPLLDFEGMYFRLPISVECVRSFFNRVKQVDSHNSQVFFSKFYNGDIKVIPFVCSCGKKDFYFKNYYQNVLSGDQTMNARTRNYHCGYVCAGLTKCTACNGLYAEDTTFNSVCVGLNNGVEVFGDWCEFCVRTSSSRCEGCDIRSCNNVGAVCDCDIYAEVDEEEEEGYEDESDWNDQLPPIFNTNTVGDYIKNTRGLGIELEFVKYERKKGDSYVKTEKYWKKKRDSSVGGDGVEMVSAILCGSEVESKVKLLLNSALLNVDKSCGYHLHISTGDFNLRSTKNLWENCREIEREMYSLMPKSREDNRYCMRMGEIYKMSTSDDDVAIRLDGVKDLNLVKSKINSCNGKRILRYCWSNFECMVNEKHIEFRLHNGTYDYDKIIHWCSLMSAIVEYSKKYGRFNLQGKNERNKLKDLLVKLENKRLIVKDTLEFYIKRQERFLLENRVERNVKIAQDLQLVELRKSRIEEHLLNLEHIPDSIVESYKKSHLTILHAEILSMELLQTALAKKQALCIDYI